MAKSANRRIERDLLLVMGHCDPEAMIRSRSTDSIRASGFVPRSKAGHMTASGCLRQSAKYPLPAGGNPHMTDVARNTSIPERDVRLLKKRHMLEHRAKRRGAAIF